MLDMYATGTFAIDATRPAQPVPRARAPRGARRHRVPPVRGRRGRDTSRPRSTALRLALRRRPGHHDDRGLQLPGLTPIQRGPTGPSLCFDR